MELTLSQIAQANTKTGGTTVTGLDQISGMGKRLRVQHICEIKGTTEEAVRASIHELILSNALTIAYLGEYHPLTLYISVALLQEFPMLKTQIDEAFPGLQVDTHYRLTAKTDCVLAAPTPPLIPNPLWEARTTLAPEVSKFITVKTGYNIQISVNKLTKAVKLTVPNLQQPITAILDMESEQLTADKLTYTVVTHAILGETMGYLSIGGKNLKQLADTIRSGFFVDLSAFQDVVYVLQFPAYAVGTQTNNPQIVEPNTFKLMHELYELAHLSRPQLIARFIQLAGQFPDTELMRWINQIMIEDNKDVLNRIFERLNHLLFFGTPPMAFMQIEGKTIDFSIYRGDKGVLYKIEGVGKSLCTQHFRNGLISIQLDTKAGSDGNTIFMKRYYLLPIEFQYLKATDTGLSCHVPQDAYNGFFGGGVHALPTNTRALQRKSHRVIKCITGLLFLLT